MTARAVLATVSEMHLEMQFTVPTSLAMPGSATFWVRHVHFLLWAPAADAVRRGAGRLLPWTKERGVRDRTGCGFGLRR
jgi:hypothetical protein